MFDIFHNGMVWGGKQERVEVVTREVNSPRVTVVLVPLVQPHLSPVLYIPSPVLLYTYSRKMADVKDPKIAEGMYSLAARQPILTTAYEKIRSKDDDLTWALLDYEVSPPSQLLISPIT
jgi:hypothetical protein